MDHRRLAGKVSQYNLALTGEPPVILNKKNKIFFHKVVKRVFFDCIPLVTIENVIHGAWRERGN